MADAQPPVRFGYAYEHLTGALSCLSGPGSFGERANGANIHLGRIAVQLGPDTRGVLPDAFRKPFAELREKLDAVRESGSASDEDARWIAERLVTMLAHLPNEWIAGTWVE